MNSITFLTAEAANITAAAQPQQQQAFGSFMPLILIVVIFYFLAIRPQQKKMKQHRAMLDALKAGDEVVTIGGIHAKVKEIQDITILLTIADKVDVKANKGSIGYVVTVDKTKELKNEK